VGAHPEDLQAVVARAPHHHSDAALVYRGEHTSTYNESQTYAVEAVSEDLRNYMARLSRRSRCFNRCVDALGRVVDLYVSYSNARQLKRRKYPSYPAALEIFIQTLSLTVAIDILPGQEYLAYALCSVGEPVSREAHGVERPGSFASRRQDAFVSLNILACGHSFVALPRRPDDEPSSLSPRKVTAPVTALPLAGDAYIHSATKG
jgi:hypothetical protein